VRRGRGRGHHQLGSLPGRGLEGACPQGPAQRPPSSSPTGGARASGGPYASLSASDSAEARRLRLASALDGLEACLARERAAASTLGSALAEQVRARPSRLGHDTRSPNATLLPSHCAHAPPRRPPSSPSPQVPAPVLLEAAAHAWPFWLGDWEFCAAAADLAPPPAPGDYEAGR
jgi:hypothetical protein